MFLVLKLKFLFRVYSVLYVTTNCVRSHHRVTIKMFTNVFKIQNNIKTITFNLIINEKFLQYQIKHRSFLFIWLISFLLRQCLVKRARQN